VTQIFLKFIRYKVVTNEKQVLEIISCYITVCKASSEHTNQ